MQGGTKMIKLGPAVTFAGDVDADGYGDYASVFGYDVCHHQVAVCCAMWRVGDFRQNGARTFSVNGTSINSAFNGNWPAMRMWMAMVMRILWSALKADRWRLVWWITVR